MFQLSFAVSQEHIQTDEGAKAIIGLEKKVKLCSNGVEIVYILYCVEVLQKVQVYSKDDFKMNSIKSFYLEEKNNVE